MFKWLLPSSVQFSRSVVSNSLWPHKLQYARLLCPSPNPGVHPNPCPSSRWCHPTISSSVIPFSSCPQSFPASGSFQICQLFTSGGQSIGVSASTLVLPMNTQDWSPLGWTGLIFLQSNGLSRVFSNTTEERVNLVIEGQEDRKKEKSSERLSSLNQWTQRRRSHLYIHRIGKIYAPSKY